jgi:molybdate/tungstate transport system permease protein
MLPAVALLALPFMSLISQTQWNGLRPAYGDWHAAWTSIALSTWAMFIIVVTGLPLAMWLARTHSWLKRAAETFVLFSLLTPSLATGILLVSAYGPYGSLGELLAHGGMTLNNNAGSFIIAQTYGGLAYFVTAARTAFEGVPKDVEEAAQDLGCSPL